MEGRPEEEGVEETPEETVEEAPRFACTKCDYVANSARSLKSHITKKHTRKKKPKRAPRRTNPPDKRALEAMAKEKPKPITGNYVCVEKCYVWPRMYKVGQPAVFSEDHQAPQKDGKVICFEKAVPGINYERPSLVTVKGVG